MLNEVCDNIKAAIIHGRTDIIRSILNACDLEGSSGELTKERLLNTKLIPEGSFLLFATQLNQGDVVRSLLSSGADPNVCSAFDAVPNDGIKQIYIEELLRATANSELGRVKQLLDAGVDVNSYDTNDTRNSPLHWAACYGSKEVVAFLIENGAHVNSLNSCGATPLHDAVDRGDKKVCAELIQAGADISIIPHKGKFTGKTALMLARNKPEIMEIIKSKFKNIDNADNPEQFTKQEINALLNESDHSDQNDMIEHLANTHIKSPAKPLITNTNLHLLWPQPQKIIELSGPGFLPQKQLHISVLQGTASIHRVLDVWEISRPALLSLGYLVKIGDVQPSCGKFSSSPIECSVNSNLFRHQDAYQIHISANKIHMIANSLQGLHYSILTFTQLLKLNLDSPLPSVLIQDYSVLRHRGVLLDISPRGRIPNLEYLFSIIDLLSSLKINYLHLYTRLLPSCEWQLCYTKSEMVAIDRRSQDRFITLVPVLDVDDNVTVENLETAWQTFQEILTCFPNLTYIHIGPRLALLLTQTKEVFDELEETTSCCSHSLNHSVLDNSLTASNVGLNRFWPANATLMVCSNSLHAIGKNCLPKNVILMEYGFQADYDFRGWSKVFQEQGGIMCFSPGTASWNSLSGCPEAAICNIYAAVQAAQEENAIGIVVAHWSGSHHLTPHPFAGPGFLVGAGLSWNPSTHWDYLHTSLGELLDAHILQDTAGVAGKVILELGYIETYVLRNCRNQSPVDVSNLPDQDGTTLYKLLTDPDNVNLEHFALDIFARVAKLIKKYQKELLKAKLNCSFGDMVIQETLLSADLMLTACRIGRALLSLGVNPNSNMGLAVINLGVHNLPPTFRTDIANKLLAHIEQYKGAWLQRHLPAGLQTSLLILTAALHRFVPSDNCAGDFS
ncbi:UNVERIFIED_CONTAM: hypothetical protein PYX00_009235 [Menopon gallinae]|uniref:Beta-hexosaminidase bacterial type N-terminal domain-containing protein n=1 Tax=Menopon gallinae TaxID=328185 RepID=A0AAW2HAL9_9NEOP